MAKKTAIITGGAAGIGAAIAKRASDQGYRVGIVDINADKAKEMAKSLPDAIGIAADVTDAKSAEKAFETFGDTPDLLVNNAGIVRFGPLLEQSVENYRAVVEVNFVAVFIMSQAAARR